MGRLQENIPRVRGLYQQAVARGGQPRRGW
jgi:hypothetical protein